MKYELEKIKKQAEYCLHCKTKPCKRGCPLQNNIPDFIEQVKSGNVEEAYKILSETTIFEPICGRICPHKSQCEGNCIRGIKGDSVNIGELETFVGDYILERNVGNDTCINNGQTNKRKESCNNRFRTCGYSCSILFIYKRIQSDPIRETL